MSASKLKVQGSSFPVEGPMVRAINDASYTKRFRQLLPAATPEQRINNLLLPTLLRYCAEAWGFSVEDLKSGGRVESVTHARFCAMRLLRRLTFCTLQSIGRMLWETQHTTIMHGLKRAEELMELDPLFRANSEAIEAELRAQFPTLVRKP